MARYWRTRVEIELRSLQAELPHEMMARDVAHVMLGGTVGGSGVAAAAVGCAADGKAYGR